MTMHRRLFVAFFSILFCLTPGLEIVQAQSVQTPLTVGTGSARVPAGTLLKIAFNTQMDSRITQAGEPFTAFIQQDFKSGERVVLPMGSLVRGRIRDVKRPGLFSRGGAITLDFDHVVLPSGELLPLNLNLSTDNVIVNPKGALYSDPGIGKKVNQSVQEGVQIFQNIKEAGVKSGQNLAGGLGMIATVPAAVVGGAAAGTAVTTGKAALAVIGRGDSVIIRAGDTATIDFGGSFNLPTD